VKSADPEVAPGLTWIDLHLTADRLRVLRGGDRLCISLTVSGRVGILMYNAIRPND
jgi:hypothetical protein